MSFAIDDFENTLGSPKSKKNGDFNHLDGHEFENYLKELFNHLGYDVIRTKLSGDQGADLILKKDNEKTVVQAKKYSGPVSNKAIQEVVASKKFYDANHAMVVTTGIFTKSAIDLAKSNNVELFDKNKLQKIVSELNSSSDNGKKYTNEQSVRLDKESFPIVCPFCNSKIRLKLIDLPVKSKSKTMPCSECNLDMSIQIPEKFYICSGCKRDFNTVQDKIKHSKNCEKLKERKFKCKSCNKEFTLDDSEFDELKLKRKLDTNCPSCKKPNNLTKR